MSENDVVRGILQQNRVALRRHLILSKTVLDELRTSGVIPDVIKRRILSEPSAKQVDALLECIEKQGMTSFRKFMEVLKTTGHNWLVEQMLDTDVTVGTQTTTVGGSHKYTGPTSQPPSSIPVGVMKNTAPPPMEGLSLANLLGIREEPEVTVRGTINARQMFSQPPLPDNLHFYGAMMPPVQQQVPQAPMMPQRHTAGAIPMNLYGLNQAFADEEQKHKQALSILQQEETAIRQLMEQNARQQGTIRRKQQAVQDINEKLKHIHMAANDVYEPVPNANIGQYRLQQLNQIPWSID